MERNSVESTMIAGIGHDSETSTLEIEFNNGQVWQYFDFTESDYSEFSNSDSIGKYFLQNIRGQYTENQIG